MSFAREAIAFLRGAHTDTGGDLARALAMAVLRVAADVPAEWSRLALDVRDGDPAWAAKAVTLAGLVLDEQVDEDDARAGGRR